MSSLGQVRVGHKAPYFECEAVINGVITDVSINTYIHPTIQGEEPHPDAPWLMIMFIPAAFSFVCPTEVLAFQNCLDEFKDRNCSVVFVSVDTKHSLWHWQNVPRQYGGLGHIDIPLLSDPNHRIVKDYGVLIEEEGVSLRGMFILDGEGIVQQVTLNNLTVGRSVLEALRLLEAFQAVAKHGVLCPIDWKPNSDAVETMNTISNTLTESYEERLANLQKEFGDTQVTDLDAKHKSEDSSSRCSNQKAVEDSAMEVDVRPSDTPMIKANSGSPPSSPPPGVIKQVVCTRGMPRSPSPNPNYKSQHHDSPRTYNSPTLTPSGSFHSARSSSTPTRGVTPLQTPTVSHPVRPAISGNARHSRGRSSSVRSPLNQELNTLFGPPAPSLFPVFRQHASPTTDLSPGHTVAPSTPGARKPVSSHAQLSQTYESRRGSHVVLEFADPTSGTRTGSSAMAASMRATIRPEAQRAHSQSQTGNKPPAVTSFSRARTASEPGRQAPPVPPTSGGGQTRLQIAFEAVKKMGAGLSSPRLDYAPRKSSQPLSAGAETKDPGYFDIVTEEGVEVYVEER